MLNILPVLFATVACLYAAAGFGGGSTYIALLAISGIPLAGIPVLALSCNIIVTVQGSFLLIRRGHAEWSRLVPILMGSIPLAFLGGAWRLPERAFVAILAFALTLAGVAMLLQKTINKYKGNTVSTPHPFILATAGALLGLIAGITGIGGGIYLAPVMHLLNWAKTRTIATCTSLFIAFNSLAGLIGQSTKGSTILEQVPLWLLIACPLAVLVGGRLGSYLLVKKLPAEGIRKITACVILLVAIRLWSMLPAVY